MNPLLKTGVAMAAVAVVAAISVTVMVTAKPSGPERVVASAELRAEEKTPATHARTQKVKEAPAERAEPRTVEEAEPPEGADARSPRPARGERAAEDRGPDAPRRSPPPAPAPELPREATPNGPSVSPEELAAAREPRRYPPRRNAAFTLTVEALGVYDVPVANAAGDEALDRGAIHLPDTGMPWGTERDKNVYVAGHRLGYPGTNSRLLFYHLDRLRPGNEVIIKGKGRVFDYKVSEILIVDPSDSWAKDPVRGRDMVSLQTCTPIPTFEKRLIVRADRVG